MNYLSVCSGIEAATVAWHHMGWKPVGFSEIEKFPSNVLAHHYPNVTNYGDMTKFKEWNINDTVELLVGGTPCQSFSVAGLRKGLADPRGNLMLTYLAMADHFKPKWLLWENVPGVLSSNRGADFGALLQGMAQLGYGFAYRVLDAQHFGVPQRRRRVFVVGCLGDWRSAAKVLFESESLCGDITPSRETRKEIAKCITRGVGQRYDFETETMICADVAPTITSSGAGWSRPGNVATEDKTYVACIGGQHPNAAIGENISPTLTNAMGSGGGHVPLINDMRVRRLTPVECERLQGFPDNYTNIPNAPDTGRYKALGNSMAVPVMRWIGERINEQR